MNVAKPEASVDSTVGEAVAEGERLRLDLERPRDLSRECDRDLDFFFFLCLGKGECVRTDGATGGKMLRLRPGVGGKGDTSFAGNSWRRFGVRDPTDGCFEEHGAAICRKASNGG